MYKDEKTGRICWGPEDQNTKTCFEDTLNKVLSIGEFIDMLLSKFGMLRREQSDWWMRLQNKCKELGLVEEEKFELRYSWIDHNFEVLPKQEKW
jgi:hypothetical protein